MPLPSTDSSDTLLSHARARTAVGVHARAPRVLCALAALILCNAAFAQGFPGGGEHGGYRGGHSPAPDSAHRAPPPDAAKRPAPLENLLQAAHALRESLLLDQAQTERWADMQADLRDAAEKQRALPPKPADATQVPNPALLFVEDMASAESDLAAALGKSAKSMQAAFAALDERQKKVFATKMSEALSAPPPH